MVSEGTYTDLHPTISQQYYTGCQAGSFAPVRALSYCTYQGMELRLNSTCHSLPDLLTCCKTMRSVQPSRRSNASKQHGRTSFQSLSTCKHVRQVVLDSGVNTTSGIYSNVLSCSNFLLWPRITHSRIITNAQNNHTAHEVAMTKGSGRG